jgi:microcin C transport system substrate-binding protein
MNTFRLRALILLSTLAAAGCGRPSTDARAQAPAAAPPPVAGAFPGMEADLQRTLKEQSNFYLFKTKADLEKDTAGLTWEDGSDLPPIGDPAAKKGGTLNLWIPDFPGTFRTIGPNSNASFREYMSDYVALGFVRKHPNVPGRIMPELASSWAVDRARKTVFYRLDPDARWSDGVPFTTEDVVFSWYLFRSPITVDPWLNDMFTKTYEALTVYDDHTFSVTLKEYRPDIVLRAGAATESEPPFPKHFFKDFGPDWAQTYDWRVCPTVGAYTIKDEDIRRTTSVTLSHVKGWWAENRRFMKGRFNPDRIHLSVIHDPDKAFESFVRGDLDIFPLSIQLWYNKLPDNHPSVASGFTTKATFFNQIPPPDFGLWINESKPYLSDLEVRLGIQSATNFELVCKQYFRGDAVRQDTWSDGYGWDVNPKVRPRPFEPAVAREHFAKAGFSRQGPDGVLMNAAGTRLSFTVTSTYRRYQDVLIILKQEALKAGLELNVEILDEVTGFQKMLEKKHDIALAAFRRPPEMFPRFWETASGANAYDVPYLPDGSPNPARTAKPSTNNFCMLANPEIDRLIGLYDKTATMEEVKDLAAKLEKSLFDEACWVPGWKLPFYRVAYRPWVKWPATFDAMQSTDFQEFWLMWIDPDEQKEVLAAKAEGRSLAPHVVVYDRYREP